MSGYAWSLRPQGLPKSLKTYTTCWGSWRKSYSELLRVMIYALVEEKKSTASHITPSSLLGALEEALEF